MSGSETGGSVERVRAALLAAGHPDTITQFPAGTRTAADAAAAVGCDRGADRQVDRVPQRDAGGGGDHLRSQSGRSGEG